MKLTVGNYEIDVKVKYTFEERANATATKYFLNLVSAALAAEAERETQLGCPNIAEDSRKKSDQIYEFLKNKKFYD